MGEATNLVQFQIGAVSEHIPQKRAIGSLELQMTSILQFRLYGNDGATHKIVLLSRKDQSENKMIRNNRYHAQNGVSLSLSCVP